jgi:hypothetical protein
MIAVVCPFTEYKFYLVPSVREGGKHLLVSQGPIAVFIVKVVTTILQEYADRLFARALANQRGVIVPSVDVGKATNVTEDLAKLVGTFPGHSEGADTPAALPADGPLVGIASYMISLLNLWKYLLD